MNEDKTLGDTYRELSREQTSSELDKRILSEAGQAAGGTSLRRYVRLRPLAWAATVLLSLGLLLEWQLDTTPDPAMLDEALMAPPQSADRAVKSVAGEAAAKGAAPRDERGAQDPDAAAETQIQFYVERPASDAVREAERIVEQSRSADLPAAEASALRARRAVEPPARHCDEHETADPASWYACILELERAGRDEDAASERNLLFSRFPDFEIR